MLTSVIEGALSAPAYPELAGKRVLVTGVTRRSGLGIARAFADHRARVVVQLAESGATIMRTAAEVVAPAAPEARVYGPVDTGAAVRFAKTAVQALGGLDAVVNVVPLETPYLDLAASGDDVDRLIAAQLELPLAIARIVANRMSLTWNDGLILNVATLAGRPGGATQAFAMLARSALVDMTRAHAEEWADRGIRFNAVVPEMGLGEPAPRLGDEADVASLALYLASRHGRTLSGCVFEAAQARVG